MIGKRRSLPNARVLILVPGGYWRRLYSAASTNPTTRFTTAGFYVPGDRVWFRNPDERSSDVTGYEGSWVIYVGSGLFSNFWKRDQPFTLESKCIEIYHWRDGVQTNAAGELWLDEAKVDACVHDTMQAPDKIKQILHQMMRIRDPKGVYASGGCLDATRECPKQIFPTAIELVLPSY